jgi:hypothetical protein
MHYSVRDVYSTLVLRSRVRKSLNQISSQEDDPTFCHWRQFDFGTSFAVRSGAEIRSCCICSVAPEIWVPEPFGLQGIAHEMSSEVIRRLSRTGMRRQPRNRIS